MMKTILMTVLLTVATGHAKPNIVFLFADDLDADEINCTLDRVNTWPTPNGALRVIGKGVKAGVPKELTPNIDSLAEGGMLFTCFYVNAPGSSDGMGQLDRESRLAVRRGPEIYR